MAGEGFRGPSAPEPPASAVRGDGPDGFRPCRSVPRFPVGAEDAVRQKGTGPASGVPWARGRAAPVLRASPKAAPPK
ncbi:hypothetical protein GCM10010360_24690 [Streptomyces nogalater]